MKNNYLSQIRRSFVLSILGVWLLHFSLFSQQNDCFEPALVNHQAICPTIYLPVCGCDGITYGNDCEALAAGIVQWKYGACPVASGCDGLNVQFGYSADPGSLTYSFQNQTSLTSGIILSYLWKFGDGLTSSEQHPVHTFASTGHYLVCLTVSTQLPDGTLCEGTSCHLIVLDTDCFDNCLYRVRVETNGLDLRASLDPPLPDTPFFFYVNWSLDDGAVTAASLEFNRLFDGPGRHKICATYPTGDFTSETCTVCREFEVTGDCINPAQIDSSVACPLAFIPVCGCDGVTYNNSCEAYNWAGVTAWRPGVCGSVCNNLDIRLVGFNSGGSLTVWTFNDLSSFPGGQINSWYWDFGNGQSSNEQNPTLNFFTPGDYTVCLTVSGKYVDGTQCGGTVCRTFHIGTLTCVDPSVIDTTHACIEIYDPVCGCNGVTYENKCVAYYYYGVTEWTPGMCPGACVEPAWIDTLTPCLAIYDPVCGCDGVTYTNDCFAISHGVLSWKKGVCCPQQNCQAAFGWVQGPGNTVILTDASQNAESWHLYFGDGDEYIGHFDSLLHVYAVPGVYQICLEISDFAGTCSDTECQIVTVGANDTQTPPEAIRYTVQPNPAADRVRVTTSGAMLLGLHLYDVFGKAVYAATKLTGGSHEFSVSNLPEGVYFLSMKTDRGSICAKVVVTR